MSGGAWGYRQFEYETQAERSRKVWLLLGALEHELDYGVSNDTCLDCAKIRVANALMSYFDDEDLYVALAVARDSKQGRCEKCIKKDWDAIHRQPGHSCNKCQNVAKG